MFYTKDAKAAKDSGLIGTGQDQAYDPVFQQRFMEVEQQSQRGVEQLHVGEELCLVDREDLLDDLVFYDKASLDLDVQTQWLVKHQALVFNGDDELVDGADAEKLQFAHEAVFIDAFYQARAFVPVNLDCRSNDLWGKRLNLGVIRVHDSSRPLRSWCKLIRGRPRRRVGG